MKALVGAFNQEKALVGAFSVIVQPVMEPMEHCTALVDSEPVNTYSLQILGFCGGRVDAVDGSESIQLGPSALQEELAPCESLGLQVGRGQPSPHV